MNREITFRVVVLGLLLSVVMGAANVYVGLKVGMTVSASIPAAAVAMLAFRTIFRSRSILEANQVQTCASAGESLAAGIIFTMPALVLMEYWTDFHFWTVTAIAFTGGTLGILFMIPMRKVFVVDNDELPYPEGVACAAVLEAGTKEDASPAGVRALLVGGLLGGVLKFIESFMQLVRGSLEGVIDKASRVFYYGGDISPMLVAVGFIVRLNVAILIFIGGAIGWLITMPMLPLPELLDGKAVTGATTDVAWALWKSHVRYVGVGAMVVGGVASIWSVRGGLVRAVKELKTGMSGGNDRQDTERDLPSSVLLIAGTLCVLLTGVIYQHFTGDISFTIVSTLVMVVMAFFFTAVASYIVGLVGNSNSPVSGMTITSVLVAGGLFSLFGFEGTKGMVAIIGVAAVVCCVASTAGDVCNDLKTGSMVGASPRHQQTMQLMGVAVAAFVMAPVLNLMHATEVIGSKALPAPQAQLFESLAKGLMGEGDLPWGVVGIGAILGVVILGIDRALAASGSKFRAHLMPIAVGIYLPFGVATPIALGGLIAYFVGRGAKDEAEVERRMHRGVLFSSGIIAGEALTKIVLAGLLTQGLESAGFEFSGRATYYMTWVIVALTLISFWHWTKPSDE
ncbi:MAG: oligopeptide transporter, OPT family [Planctomycetota bacterium]|nr:oligopeptide transporter, OPT family [Planctomycetota bacterium]